MLLTIDVGNTNIKFGIFDGDKCSRIFRMSTPLKRTADETGTFINSLFTRWDYDVKKVKGVIISSVVPDIMYSLVHGIQLYFDIEPIIVDHSMIMDIKVLKGSIKEVGADRLVNCVAARVGQTSPILIIDYGTAIKYDVLSVDGEFVTGITSPGIEICADALFQKAALIGKVDLVLPPSMIVTNTTESIQAGLLYGKIGEAEYFVKKLKAELGYDKIKTIATGGLARTVSSGTDIFDSVDPFLTLKGLKILYDTNCYSHSTSKQSRQTQALFR